MSNKLFQFILSLPVLFFALSSSSFAYRNTVTVAGIANEQALSSACEAQGMVYTGQHKQDNSQSGSITWFNTTGECASIHHHHHHRYYGNGNAGIGTLGYLGYLS